MNRHLATAIVRLSLTLGTAFVAFDLLHQTWRHTEASVLSRALSVLGVSGLGGVYGTRILVAPHHSAPFLASVTPSCSALGAILAFTTISAFLLHGPVARRVLATLLAAVLVSALNFVRIGLALTIGASSGAHAMVVFHDWIGTVIGLFSVLAGFTLFLFVLLPSNKRLLELAGAR